ncbi:putative late blight resistance protein homolog R1A-3 [Primulina huaijiensis]|uniref:putative late blight resistance protein homolog R1A-3 n=1 Tax=Primulina huaijiensis TaxID=1492673 RepID=UPI003CC72473
MAYAAVLSLMQVLQQLRSPVRFIRYEKQQLDSFQEKVSFLHDFLENHSMSTSKEVKDLEKEIRDTAYRAEDIIESYGSTCILYYRTNRRLRYLNFCKDLDRVIKEMQSYQQEVAKVKRMLDLKYVQQRNYLPVNGTRLTFSDKKLHMVGLVEDTMKIKDWLTSSSSRREIISIVGMGGIGKTTFARNLFDDSLIVYHFHVRAWVTVSQEYQMHEILLGLLDSMDKLNPDMRNVSSGELAERLYKNLKGRVYLIVMDDVWDSKVWDDIKRFFPDDNNGSRIVLTTRLKNVGSLAASTGCLHEMSFLSSSESWNLFREKAFRGEFCSPRLEGIGLEIIRNCRGLPLSIVVIGGLLSMDKTVGYWETIATALNSILAADGGQCSTIFSLSYNHLPAHLKPCFLYFAIFPEDCVIRRSKLIKLWIAEGFIKPNKSKSLEHIAEECLEDLLNRSLIMALKLGHRSKVKTYRIHDLLRDFSITQVKKEKILHVINRHTPSHPKGIRNERRVCIQPLTPFKFSKYICNSNGPPFPTRSLLFYHQDGDIIITERSFGLLRVLDMESGVRLLEFPMELVRLVHLRYLSLSCFRVIVPASISLIWGLQTLVIDIWHLDVLLCHLPPQVWLMAHLRHVQIRSIDCRLPDPPNSGVEGKNFVTLANLQTLSRIRNFRFTDEIIKRIPKLKKLRVVYDVRSKDWSQFHLGNIVCLNELESLHIESYSKIAFPPKFKFPAALKKLTLKGCHLRSEDLAMVGSLPNLEVLKLHHDACEGQVWEPNEGEFSELKFLKLSWLGLLHWKADDSHFPKLKCLMIRWCFNLKEIPIEIGNISTLELIELDDASFPAMASAKLILDEQRSMGNDVLQVRMKSNWHKDLPRYSKLR